MYAIFLNKSFPKKVERVLTHKKTDFTQLHNVARILNACGKDMARKYDLHHWDNPYLKSLIIAVICFMKNQTWLVYDDEKAVATFMTKVVGEGLHFEKLGTDPTQEKKGIGTYCIDQIESIARNHNCKKVYMEVYEPSKHAISFYEHRGYQIVGNTGTLKYKEVKMEKSL